MRMQFVGQIESDVYIWHIIYTTLYSALAENIPEHS